MIRVNKRNLEFEKIIKDKSIATTVKIFFSYKAAGDDFDPLEKNYTFYNLNPVTIKGYVRDLKPETQYWKQYGYNEGGVKELFCDAKYAQWFRNCNKVEINSDTFRTYKEAPGKQVLITQYPFKIIRVVLYKE